MTLRVVVDRDLCQGHGVCESEAPEVFRIEKSTNQVALRVDVVTAEQRRAVEAAVRYCPTHALKLIEEASS